MKIDDADIGQWLGGLFGELVRHVSHEHAGPDISDADWAVKRSAFFEVAIDDVLTGFPEPLRTKLRAERGELLAAMLRLN